MFSFYTTLCVRLRYLAAVNEISSKYPKGFKRHLEDDVGDSLDDTISVYEAEAILIARDYNNKRTRLR